MLTFKKIKEERWENGVNAIVWFILAKLKPYFALPWSKKEDFFMLGL